jgi:hypothetical protein
MGAQAGSSGSGLRGGSGRKLSAVVAAGVLAVVTTFTAAGTPAAAAAGTSAEPITSEQNPRVPAGAAWTEAYFPSSDGSGVELHADVLRPAHLPANAKTPVIISVGPYFQHVGYTGADGVDRVGPSERFRDFVDGAGLMARGYTFVMVDLRGYGGSTGCLDFLGPGEQADVRAAVEWAASQPWSTGKVGMYGKSYDANTGMVGNVLKLAPLRAIVAQQPTWNRYNYLFSNGVPRYNVTSGPQEYNDIATRAPLSYDSDRYKANAEYEKANPHCLADNLTDTQDPNPDAPFWRVRNLAERAAGTHTPLFVTSGFIEPNTKPEDMEKYLTNHRGPERGWLGPWDHVRGNDTTADGRLKMGRTGWFDEVMRFFDKHLLGVDPSVTDPAFVVADSLANWRAQPKWPVSSTSYQVRLSPGRYVDDGAPTSGYWTWSTPASTQVRVTGTPEITLRTRGGGNVWVRLWDVAPDGTATMFNENVALLERGATSFALKGTDWILERGHQLGVQIGTIASDEWLDTPSGRTVTVHDARLALDVQDPRSDVPTHGDRSPYLDEYLAANTTTLADVGPGTFRLRLSRGCAVHRPRAPMSNAATASRWPGLSCHRSLRPASTTTPNPACTSTRAWRESSSGRADRSCCSHTAMCSRCATTRGRRRSAGRPTSSAFATLVSAVCSKL